MASETRFYDCTPASTSGLGDWVQIEIADPPVRPVGDGDIVVTHVDSGEVLPHLILGNIASRLRFTVGLRSPTDVAEAQRIKVVISDAGAAHPGYSDWVSGDHTGGASVGPSIVLTDGNGATFDSGTPMGNFVHPAAMKVPAGSWMKFVDAIERDAGVGTVTHVRIDTPFPGGDDQWENPHLFYSTDDGASWAEWNASINPLAPWPGGQFNSDVGFIIKADGDLYCFWRGGDFELDAKVVSGTCLADAAAGALIEPTTGGEVITAPSMVEHEGVWHLFYRASDSSIRRQTSNDEGLTFGSPVEAIAVAANSDWVSGGGWAAERKFWHGSVMGPFSDGCFYGAFSENPSGNANNGYAGIRLFRALTPEGPWQASRSYVMDPGTGLGTGTWYQACPFEKSDGSLALIVSALDSDYHVTTQDITIGAAAIDEQEAFQFDTGDDLYTLTSTYDVDGTDRGTVTEVDQVAEYRAEYSTDDGETWTPVADWGSDLSAQLDSTLLPDGPLRLRVQARDASTPADVSTYDEASVTVDNVPDIEYRVTYQEDGGVETIAQDWTADDLSEQIDTATLADGPLVVRVYARDASSPADVSVSTLNLTVANGAATTIAPAFIDTTSEVYAPTITEGVPAGTIAPAFIEATSEVYAPLLVPGAAVIAPEFIEAASVVYAPVIRPVPVFNVHPSNILSIQRASPRILTR